MTTAMLINLQSGMEVGQPARIIQQPRAKIGAHYNQTLRMSCKAEGTPPIQYSWQKIYKNGTAFPIPKIMYTSNEQGSTLYFMNIGNKDKLSYRCFASNAFGRDLSFLSQIDVYYIRQYEPTNKVMRVQLGAKVEIPCTPIREQHPPNPIFTWSWMTRESFNPTEIEELVETNRMSIRPDNGSLIIAHTTTKDFEKLRERALACFQVNKEITQKVGLDRYTLQGIPGPSLTESQRLVYAPKDTQQITAGTSFSLKCIFVGNPTPYITWLYPNRIPKAKIRVNTEASIELLGINAEALHTGRYTCEGRHPATKELIARAVVHIQVVFPPVFSPRKKLTDKKTVVGNDVFYECEEDRNTLKPVNIVWYINGDKLRPSTRHKVERSTLTLKAVTKNDSALIQCSISNKLGTIISSTYLLVLSPLKWADGEDHILTEEVTVTESTEVFEMNCEIVLDPRERTAVTWCREVTLEECQNNDIAEDDDSPYITFRSNKSILVINVQRSIDEKNTDAIAGIYTCVVRPLLHGSAYNTGEKLTRSFYVQFSTSPAPWALPLGLILVFSTFLICFYAIGLKYNKCPTIPEILNRIMKMIARTKAAKKQANQLEQQLQKALEKNNEYSARIKLMRYRQLGERRRVSLNDSLVEMTEENIKDWDRNCTVEEKLLKAEFVRAIISGKETKMRAALEKYEKLALPPSRSASFETKFVQATKNILKQKQTMKLQGKVKQQQLSLIKVLKTNNAEKIKAKIEQCENFDREHDGLVKINKGLIMQSKQLVKELEWTTKREVKRLSTDFESTWRASVFSDDFIRENEKLLEAMSARTSAEEHQNKALRENELREELEQALLSNDEMAIRRGLYNYKNFGIQHKADIDFELLQTAQDIVDDIIDIEIEQEMELKNKLEDTLYVGEKEEVLQALENYMSFGQKHGSDISIDSILVSRAQAQYEKMDLRSQLGSPGHRKESRRVSTVIEMDEQQSNGSQEETAERSFASNEENDYAERDTATPEKAKTDGDENAIAEINLTLQKALSTENVEDLEKAIYEYQDFVLLYDTGNLDHSLMNKAQEILTEKGKWGDVSLEIEARKNAAISVNTVGDLTESKQFQDKNNSLAADYDLVEKTTSATQRLNEISEGERLKLELLDAVYLTNEDDIVITLAAYREYCLKYSDCKHLDKTLVDSADEILQGFKEKREHKETELSKLLTDSLCIKNVRRLETSLRNYEAFANENTNKITINGTLVKAAQSTLNSLQEKCREDLKVFEKPIQDAIRAKNGMKVNAELHNYRHYAKDNGCEHLMNETLIDEAHKCVETTNSARQDDEERYEEVVDDLAVALRKPVLSDLRLKVGNYEAFRKQNPGICIEDTDLMNSVKSTLNRLEEQRNVDVKRELNNAVKLRDCLLIKSALTDFREIAGPSDEAVLQYAEKLLLELDKENIRTERKLKENLRLAVFSLGVKEIKECLSKYEGFLKRQGGKVPVDEALLSSAADALRLQAKRQGALAKEQESLLRQAMETQNIDDISKTLVTYSNLDEEVVDKKLIKKANGLVNELKTRMKFLTKEYGELKNLMTKAKKTRDICVLNETVVRCETFIKQNNDFVWPDEELLQDVKKRLDQLKANREKLIDEATPLAQDLEYALKEGKKSEIKMACLKYKNFFNDHSKDIVDMNIDMQNELIEEGESEVLKLEKKEKELAKEYMSLKNEINTAIEAQKSDLLRSNLSKMEIFAETNANEKIIDKNFINETRRALENIVAQEDKKRRFDEVTANLKKAMKQQNIEDLRVLLSEYEELEKTGSKQRLEKKMMSEAVKVLKTCEKNEALINNSIEKLKTAKASGDINLIKSAIAEYEKKCKGIGWNPDEQLISCAKIIIQEHVQRVANLDNEHEMIKEELKGITLRSKLEDAEMACAKYEDFIKYNTGIITADEFLLQNVKEIIQRVKDVTAMFESISQALRGSLVCASKSQIYRTLCHYEEFTEKHKNEVQCDNALLSEARNLIAGKPEASISTDETRASPEQGSRRDSKTGDDSEMKQRSINDVLSGVSIKKDDKIDESGVAEENRSDVTFHQSDSFLHEMQEDKMKLSDSTRSTKSETKKVEKALMEHEKRRSYEIPPEATLPKKTASKTIIASAESVEKHKTPWSEDVSVKVDISSEKTSTKLQKFPSHEEQDVSIDKSFSEIDKYSSQQTESHKQEGDLCAPQTTTGEKTTAHEAEGEMESAPQESIENERLQNEANKVVKSAENRLKRKVKRATKENDRQTLLQAVVDYESAVKGAGLEPDEKITKKCSKYLKTVEDELHKEHEILKKELKHVKRDDIHSVRASWANYKRFVEKNRDMFSLDETLKPKVKKSEKRPSAALAENDKRKQRLLTALQEVDKSAILEALEQYKTFVASAEERTEDELLLNKTEHVLEEIERKISKEVIAEHLRLSTKLQEVRGSGSLSDITDALSNYETFVKENRGLLRDKKLVSRVKSTIVALNRKQLLKDAIEQKDSSELQKVVQESEECGDSELFQKELKMAKGLKDKLSKLNDLRDGLLNMDREQMAKVREEMNPPTAVHDVFRAALLMLGTHEDDTNEWVACHGLLTSLRTRTYVGLPKRIRDFKLKHLRPEIAARVLEMLEGYTGRQLKNICSASAQFYQWTVSSCRLCVALADKPPQPAKGSSQRLILNEVGELLPTTCSTVLSTATSPFNW